MRRIIDTLIDNAPAAEAHCDGPCGVYDPASARIAAEAGLSMTKKILALTPPEGGDAAAWAAYNNTMSRYITIKEEQTHLAKEELLVLWTDYFKPPHFERYPQLNELFNQATKLAGAGGTKGSLDPAVADDLLEKIDEIAEIFWETKQAA